MIPNIRCTLTAKTAVSPIRSPRFVGNTAVRHSIIQLYCAAVHIKLLPYLNQQSISSGTFMDETAVLYRLQLTNR
ncbi:MAG: hypothetical protein GY943_04850 [Chloroflexi bacterium]|nr:hypothetical protein [Chloroflexota bacterium]